MQPTDYVTEVKSDWRAMDAGEWDALLSAQSEPTPFMRHAYLSALHDTGCASARTGWQLHLLNLRQGGQLKAACPIYLKNHSYGEYVFDWAWAQAYERHGLAYFPKAVIVVPFTPVPGSRLLAVDEASRRHLLSEAVTLTRKLQASSLHVLLGSVQDMACSEELGLLQRHGVQFHWQNPGCQDFEGFLATLKQEKRKKIRQERRKVQQAGVDFSVFEGPEMTPAHWAFFYRCYAQTYAEHGNPPYLTPAFFDRMQRDMGSHWVLILAHHQGQAIGCSLLAVQNLDSPQAVAYGRYWGATQHIDSLHFETCYYQAIEWCLRRGVQRFEGGAQGEHKMARALLPVGTGSAHWIAHAGFEQAIAEFLQRERAGVAQYRNDLEMRSPLRRSA